MTLVQACLSRMVWTNGFLRAQLWRLAPMVARILLQIIPRISTLQLELAYDDKDRTGLDDEYYVKLMFVYPPKEGPTLGDGISSDMWRENKDMTGELLTKVKRNNKIMVEFNGNATISRTD